MLARYPKNMHAFKGENFLHEKKTSYEPYTREVALYFSVGRACINAGNPNMF
jgi:hypothetical protein